MPYLTIGSEKLHYLRIGSGSSVLIAFHGYGEEATTFSVFEPSLGSKYTILSFDLPYHGKTEWKTKQYFTEEDLANIVATVKQEYKVDKVSLMGYSIGGRVCLSTLKAVPESIDSVLLMAADGLVINKYYYFVTHTLLGAFLFRQFMQQHKAAVSLAEWLKNRRIISESYFRLVKKVMQVPEKRSQLLHAWPCLSRLMHRKQILQAVIVKYNLPIFIFMGVNDSILPPPLAQSFAAATNTVQVHIVDRGHRIFDADNAAQMAAVLL